MCPAGNHILPLSPVERIPLVRKGFTLCLPLMYLVCMSAKVGIRLIPLDVACELESQRPLKEALFEFGVEFPCGGNGLCRGCRVRVVKGSLPVLARERELLSSEEIEAGWRLACLHKANNDLTLELLQWGASILSDERDFRFTPSEGCAIAVDLGTTTIVAQLVDLETGRVLGVSTALNPQALFGSDIMSRIDCAVTRGEQEKLESAAREEVGRMAETICRLPRDGKGRIRKIVLVGNTVMHHLFCCIPLAPLSAYPFETPDNGLKSFASSDLGWTIEDDPVVEFLPCLQSFVGSDLLAGIEAVGIHGRDGISLLVDLGTNGEIAAGSSSRIVCASTAAGPAFEGGNISMGMRASPGAVSAVLVKEQRPSCHVIGGAAPRGICGSGLVDAVAAGLELGLIKPSGRLAGADGAIELIPPVLINQRDIREVQLAKGAVAAGIRIVLDHLGARFDDVERIFLAGAFGNYINTSGASRIGMIRFPRERISSAGNTALLGAKIALFQTISDPARSGVFSKNIEHVSLSRHERFQEIFAEEMLFPSETDRRG